MPCIVDLSLDSEDDDCFIKENDCYIYPSKRHPPAPKPLLMHTVRTPVSIRKPRALSSSSSSVISLVSPPRKPPVQARITTFFESPNKKGKSIKLENNTIEKAFSRVAPPKFSRMASPMARPIFFSKSDLFVDDDEAPVPSAFDGPIDEGTFECPMEIDSHPPAVVLPPSSPVCPSGSVCPEERPVFVPADMGPVLQRDRPIKPLPPRRERPVKWIPPYQPGEVVAEPVLESSESGGTLLPTRSEVTAEATVEVVAEVTAGVTAEAEVVEAPGESPVSAGLPVQTEASTVPVGGATPDLPIVSTAHSDVLNILVCQAHADPDCDAVECISDFFDEYSPFHDTLSVKKLDDKVERDSVVEVERPEMSKPLPPIVPPTVNVADIRALRRQHISLLLASDTLDPMIRRPYMPLTSRQFLKEVGAQPGVWRELFADSDGCLIHVGFTPKECIILGSCVHTYLQHHPNGNTMFPGLCESGEPSEDLHYYLKAAFTGFDPAIIFEQYIQYPMDRLPGRTKKDCVDFLVDAIRVLPNPRDPFFCVDLSVGELKVGGEPKLQSRGVRRMLGELGCHTQMAERSDYAMSLFQPVWRFKDGASDILDIQWSSDGRRFGMGCVTFSDGYNRAGNLMLGASDPWKVKMLYRHAFKIRQQEIGNLDKFKWATVSCVRFSNNGSLFYSGSYDGFVKIWNGKTGKWIYNIPLDAEVVTMATSPVVDQVIAAATKDGSVHLIRVDDGGPVKFDALHMSEEDEKKHGLYASCLLFGNQRKPSWLIAGYDTNGRQAHGGFVIFDVEAGKTVFGVAKNGKRTYSTRHFDIAMHAEGTTLVTASLQRPNKTHSPGIHSVLRVFDIRQMSNPMLLKSPQRDINAVTISPCQNYVTSSGTTGSTLVWDLRNPLKVLAELKHDETKLLVGPHTNLELDDTGVTFAQWSPYHRLYTGSSDGVVKEWDISAGQPFVRDIAKVDTQIMSAAFSPSWDELIVGECSGTATLFSTRGDEGVPVGEVEVDWTEDREMMSPEEGMPTVDSMSIPDGGRYSEESEEEESGVLLARQMLEEGKMWIRDGVAWAVREEDTEDVMEI